MVEVLSGRKPPTRYFVEFEDPDWEGEPASDTCVHRNAPNLALARRLAKQIGDKFDTHVAIYERQNVEQIEAPYGPWVYDTEWVEDGA